MNRLTLVLFFFIFSSAALCQSEVTLLFTNDSHKRFKKNPKKIFSDSLKAMNYLVALRNKALEEGYLLASIDKLNSFTPEWQVDFNLGQRFSKMTISIPQDEKSFLMKGPFTTERTSLHPNFRADQLGKLMVDWHKEYLNSGYPFARIDLIVDSILVTEGFGKLKIEKGPMVKWTKINLRGDSTVSVSFISSLLQIKIGELYSEKNIDKITERIKQVPFLEEIKPFEILFTQEGIELFLYLKSKPVSSLNGYLGLQPKSNNTGYGLAGDIQLKLWNIFKRGELFDLNWRNIQGQTQQLRTQLNLPYLFKSPFGLYGEFNLNKRDSSFLEVQTKGAVEYQLGGGKKFFFYYQRTNSSILKAGLNSTTFTNLGNVSSNNYGLGFQVNKVDYLPNPRIGILLEISGSVGTRESRSVDSISSLKNTQYSGQSKLSLFVPITARNILRLANQSWFLNTRPIYQNELLRFGGLLNQRGFNEDELFGSTVTTSTLEYRFLLDKDSRIFAFYDVTWYENNSLNYFNDLPYGFGGGIAFGTNIGTFSILYALGSQQNNPVLLQNGRVHFGYVAYF